MNPARWQQILADVIAVSGVRGAIVVAAEDGLVVHEAAVEGLDTADVAALAAVVVRRGEAIAAATDDSGVRLCTLTAQHGTVIAAQGEMGLWLVAITEPGAELGRLRLLLGDLAPELA